MPFSTARKTPPLPIASHAARCCLGLAAFVLAFASQAPQTASADNETRTLSLHHTHTGETLTVTFKRNGRYDDAGLSKLNHFLRDWRNDDQTRMDPQLFDIVWEVYRDVGSSAPVQIISAYRSPATNSMLRRRSRGVAQFSQHMIGKAMDFAIPNASLEQVRAAGLRLQRGGVGFYPTSGFVHLDVGSIRHWPRMTHDQLARVFPDGRTVHVPSDGRPLSGYALALADVERRGSSPSHVSLAAARDAGVLSGDRVASAEKSKRSFFARIFGAGQDDDDEDGNESRASRVTSRAKLADAAPAKPIMLASAVPLPRARPASQDGGAETTVVAQRPARIAPAFASLQATPAQIVQARGVWDGVGAFRVADASTVRSAPGERLAWQVGPQPVAARGVSVATKSTPLPRPRPVVLASAGSEMTASLPPWPGSAAEERVPLVLAYASPSPAEPTHRAAPMGSLQPATASSIVRKTPAVRGGGERPLVPTRLGDNPWLRGVIATPSMQTSMGVTVLGPPNYRQLTRMMHKPKSAVPNSFAEEPEFGLTTNFTGPAVAFVPTVAFGTLTAALR